MVHAIHSVELPDFSRPYQNQSDHTTAGMTYGYKGIPLAEDTAAAVQRVLTERIGELD